MEAELLLGNVECIVQVADVVGGVERIVADELGPVILASCYNVRATLNPIRLVFMRNLSPCYQI